MHSVWQNVMLLIDPCISLGSVDTYVALCRCQVFEKVYTP